jgi:hypothetical protein
MATVNFKNKTLKVVKELTVNDSLKEKGLEQQIGVEGSKGAQYLFQKWRVVIGCSCFYELRLIPMGTSSRKTETQIIAA